MRESGKKRRRFWITAISLLCGEVVLLVCAVFIPKQVFQYGDGLRWGVVRDFEVADVQLDFSLTEQENINRLHNALTPNFIGDINEITEDTDRAYYADLLLEQIDSMHRSSVIPADLWEALYPVTVAADTETKITVTETENGNFYMIQYEYSDTIYCGILYDAEWNKTLDMTLILHETNSNDYEISNENCMAGYIAWLELGGLYDWTYSTSAHNAVANSNVARLSLLVYSEVIDDILHFNLRFYES